MNADPRKEIIFAFFFFRIRRFRYPLQYDPTHFVTGFQAPRLFDADIEDITRWREDMNFMFEWQTQYLTSERSERVRYCVCHENIKFISSSQRVMFFLLYGDKISEIAHFYSLLVASVEKFFENLQIVQGLLFCVFVVETFGKLFHLFIV